LQLEHLCRDFPLPEVFPSLPQTRQTTYGWYGTDNDIFVPGSLPDWPPNPGNGASSTSRRSIMEDEGSDLEGEDLKPYDGEFLRLSWNDLMKYLANINLNYKY